jgi:nucleotide-binding universal stress UspA family protein
MSDLTKPQTGVVVGVDGTASARRALLWAAREATFRGCPLVVTHAYRHLGWPAGPEVDRANRRRAMELVWDAVDVAAAAERGLTVVPDAAQGPVRQVMYEAVERPELYVVGYRNRGTVAGALLESTGVDLARQSPRPVVVVKEAGARPGPHPFAGHVVAGVDHSLRSGAVLAFAFAAAANRGRALAVVHVAHGWSTDAWQDLLFDELHLAEPDPDWQLLERLVKPLQALYPRVPVKLALHQAPVAAGLLRAAGGAELLVVGATGHGRIGGTLGASVGRAMVTRAPCPVAAVPLAPAVTLAAHRELLAGHDRLTRGLSPLPVPSR